MLTFFDYLRQRAFESVLAGAQEALELLESQKDHSEPPSSPALDFEPFKATKQEESKSPTENTPVEDDELLPAPRRRGRPWLKPKGNG